MSAPDWVQAMRRSRMYAGISLLPDVLDIVEALAGALGELVAAEDQYVHEAGMELSDPISDAVTVAREALARYHHGPGATTGGGDQ